MFKMLFNFIFGFVFFGVLFYLIWVYSPDFFKQLVFWAERSVAFMQSFLERILDGMKRPG